MAQMSRRFNFDDFDEQIREALEANSEGMAELLPSRVRRPGEIGGVACRPTLTPATDPNLLSLEAAPQDNVVDLNRNVFDLHPPDDAA